jgi:hypothetical protein
MKKCKGEIVTFKVDESMIKAMNGISNRSEFIRSAVLAALDNSCPLCKGTGILSPEQKKHWISFERDHALEECAECHEMTIRCKKGLS